MSIKADDAILDGVRQSLDGKPYAQFLTVAAGVTLSISLSRDEAPKFASLLGRRFAVTLELLD